MQDGVNHAPDLRRVFIGWRRAARGDCAAGIASEARRSDAGV